MNPITYVLTTRARRIRSYQEQLGELRAQRRGAEVANEISATRRSLAAWENLSWPRLLELAQLVALSNWTARSA